MTSFNLAVVFGPNLAWSENRQMSLTAIGPINAFTEHILSHQEDVEGDQLNPNASLLGKIDSWNVKSTVLFCYFQTEHLKFFLKNIINS